MNSGFSEPIAELLGRLSEKPAHFPDCCPALSRPLLDTILEQLPKNPALTLSIGSGTGLFEAMLLQASQKDDQLNVNVYGVEVDTCMNKYLPEDRLWRVHSTSSLHADAVLASTLIFVYPRNANLIAMYLDAFITGALNRIIWLGPRNDWVEVKERLRRDFPCLRLISRPGVAEYELLAIATMD